MRARVNNFVPILNEVVASAATIFETILQGGCALSKRLA
jgi:hypothetical protein